MSPRELCAYFIRCSMFVIIGGRVAHRWSSRRISDNIRVLLSDNILVSSAGGVNAGESFKSVFLHSFYISNSLMNVVFSMPVFIAIVCSYSTSVVFIAIVCTYSTSVVFFFDIDPSGIILRGFTCTGEQFTRQ
uniref:Uncharacterized protein n=1 Tax=Cacopsylla melanoneura TaxID=428564 RepID=A0A8D8Z2R9_9HEMI